MGMLEAGVAIILNAREGVEALFIKRKVSPKDPWSGHIAFPGGRREPGDKDILETVYREVLEEVSIDLREVGELIYELPPAFPGNMPEMRVYPYVFKLVSEVRVVVGSEVERFFWVRLDALEKERVNVESTVGVKVVDAYVFYVDGEKQIIWGMTKRILDDLFKHSGKIFSRL